MTTAQDQQSRAEFEAWLMDELDTINWEAGLRDWYFCRRDDGDYVQQAPRERWATWQAARALPPGVEQPIARLREITKGIDADECADPQGWWETGTGAEFGSKKLAELEALVRGLIELPAGVEPVGSVYTIFAMVPGGRERAHVTLHRHLPAGTKLYTAAQVLAMGRVPPGFVAVPVEPTSKQVVLMAGAILHQQHGTGDTRHPYWPQAVEQAEKAYRAAIDFAPRPPAAQEGKPLTDEQIRKWWASENGLEDCDMGKLIDFTAVVREVEAKLGIEPTP